MTYVIRRKKTHGLFDNESDDASKAAIHELSVCETVERNSSKDVGIRVLGLEVDKDNEVGVESLTVDTHSQQSFRML